MIHMSAVYRAVYSFVYSYQYCFDTNLIAKPMVKFYTKILNFL